MSLQIFKNNRFGEVRVAKTEDNEPMFCLADVCKILDIDNPRQVKKRLNSNGMTLIDLQQLGENGVVNNDGVIINKLGNTKSTFINEANFYKVVFQSRKPEAEEFTDWVTSEVLPSIRKHGGYLTPEKLEEVLLSPDTIMKLAQNLKAEQERRIEAENRAASLEEDVAYQAKELKEAGPKVEYYEQVMNSKSLINTTIIAKDLGMSATKLNKILHQLGVIYKIGGTWVLYSQYDNKGYTGSVTKTVSDRHGVVHTIVHNLWTQKGRKFIYDFLAYHQVISMNTHTTLLRGLPKE